MIVLGNAGGLLNLILFVFLLIFLASIFASQLFRGEIPEKDDNGNEIRVPFFDIFNSFIGMYQIFSSENWTTILYNITGYEKEFGTAWIGASFCILWFIFANRMFSITRFLRPVLTSSSYCAQYVHCCHSRKFRCFRRRKTLAAG